VLFKGSSLQAIQTVAIDTLRQAEANEARLVQQVAALQTDLKEMTVARDAYEEEVNFWFKKHQQLEAKCQAITDKGNQARKHASARGNRYKMKYDQLLETIDTLLPGAKALLTQTGIGEREKAKRLAQLEEKIQAQKTVVRQHIHYDVKKRRDVFNTGYGKQHRLLCALIAKRRKLQQCNSYDDQHY